MSTPRGPRDPADLPLAPGVHRLDVHDLLDVAMGSLVAAGWAVASVELSGAREKQVILRSFAEALSFPAWVGWNWDALDDALRDLSWWPAGEHGRILLVSGLDGTPASAEHERAMIRDILRTATASWSATDTPLIVLLLD